MCTKKDLLKYSKQAGPKNNVSSDASTPTINEKIRQQKQTKNLKNEQKTNLKNDLPAKEDNATKRNKQHIDGLKSEISDRTKQIGLQESSSNPLNAVNEKMEDPSSSRKTSSSSNGSNSTSDSSSSFSSHPLKTLPEHPDISTNPKTFNPTKKDSVVDSNKSLLWQDDPGQLLNAWLGELDSLQKVSI